MSAKIVLKSERGRFRYYVNDDAGNVVLSGPFITSKELAVSYVEKIVNAEDLANHIQAQKGPDGKWVFRCELHASREGEKGQISDSIPLGFGSKSDSEADCQKSADVFVKAAKGAEFVDET